MNNLLLVALIGLLLFRAPASPIVVHCMSGPPKCYGNTPCGACTSCNYCAHCNAGGTCGVCKPAKKKEKQDTVAKTPVTLQCKAITKKGTRCSRNARNNGYCWQHGGK